MLDIISDGWHRTPDYPLPSPAVTARSTPGERVAALTERQKAVMRMLADGLINKQIAHRLDISVATVKTHVAAAVRRMKAKNRIHAVAMLIRADCEG
ncbi:helix-turn-helix domain-containing protein [Polymorphum gilvum]|uniref:Putative transcriptional regulator, LuxR family protein n=1 Tax=Polymorphum gilvum (strain LMG 25793 / CGMCC 1.9160 / SL003B-26A1) TaxID=991905 RepID=F2J5J1_POLGS|nr:helix-turn-helix transcriptional regulator [Polymorphum gilvum]ADZ72361.1 Putative transcriptional regulator, LuxR family protein [Polymorphum gilvum SL003B-26A1]